MLEVDGVKVSTASDPLDVYPLHAPSLRWCAKTETEKTEPGTWDTKPNRIEPNFKNPNRPSSSSICNNFSTLLLCIVQRLQLLLKCMLSTEFGWLGKPEKDFGHVMWMLHIVCSYISCFKCESNIYNKYVIIIRICNKRWNTKPEVHVECIKGTLRCRLSHMFFVLV